MLVRTDDASVHCNPPRLSSAGLWLLMPAWSVWGRAFCKHSPALRHLCHPCLSNWVKELSTVLAQDRFFSVSLSFTLDKQDPQSHHDDVIDRGPQDFHSSLCCRFDDQKGTHGNLNGVLVLPVHSSPGSFLMRIEMAKGHTRDHPCGRGNSAISDA